MSPAIPCEKSRLAHLPGEIYHQADDDKSSHHSQSDLDDAVGSFSMHLTGACIDHAAIDFIAVAKYAQPNR
jgi:hypothetical protein